MTAASEWTTELADKLEDLLTSEETFLDHAA
jgi:hypothetical protein